MAVRSELWIKRLLADRYRASFSMRFLSFCYDMLGLFLLWLLIYSVITGWLVISAEVSPFDYSYLREHKPHLLYLALGWVTFFYIFIFPLINAERQTMGMMLIGLKIVDENAEKLTRVGFLKRECLKWVLFPGFFLTLTSEKQSLADKLSKTFITSY
ncbi:hypothetical protein DS745_12815 [Anaerobacillus alkaliphilus]|uniref:RDD domain-containing protein n=1 Tax=Anaerobacillus alkaliphilus TaxID=1548597 RepID=A0A4Q0VS21_9BACI|nr:RDD family protein [Anaerobacillus alkaliphilus]RXJ00404.1 hypothetical protein DS745_12815 [Anaerobacillus alkaliphilus]